MTAIVPDTTPTAIMRQFIERQREKLSTITASHEWRGAYGEALTNMEAVLDAIPVRAGTVPSEEEIAGVIFCAGHDPENPCEPGCHCDEHYNSIVELLKPDQSSPGNDGG